MSVITMNLLRRVLARFAVLAALYLVIDQVIPMPLVFWNQTVPLSDRLLQIALKLHRPHDAAQAVFIAQLCVWSSAAMIGSLWLYGLAIVLTGHPLEKSQHAAKTRGRGPLARGLARVAGR